MIVCVSISAVTGQVAVVVPGVGDHPGPLVYTSQPVGDIVSVSDHLADRNLLCQPVANGIVGICVRMIPTAGFGLVVPVRRAGIDQAVQGLRSVGQHLFMLLFFAASIMNLLHLHIPENHISDTT